MRPGALQMKMRVHGGMSHVLVQKDDFRDGPEVDDCETVRVPSLTRSSDLRRTFHARDPARLGAG